MNEFFFPSADGKTQIHAQCWKPEGAPRAILQVIHGMQEYIGRYAGFGEYLAEQGIMLVGNDHLGHGRSVYDDSRYGFFAKKNGNACLLEDIHTLRRKTQEEYPGVPYFVLGHSMGSFLVRQYMQLHGKGLSGVVVMGTGSMDIPRLKAAQMICTSMAKFRGWEYRSAFVDNLACGSYNKQFSPARTDHDWLTKDEAIVDKYEKDPWCMFRFTLNGYYNLFYSFEKAQSPKLTEMIPKNLPVLLVSGTEDPVGSNGKGVKKAYAQYKKAGIRDLLLKLYENDRHEILNELDKETVYSDLLHWMEQRL